MDTRGILGQGWQDKGLLSVPLAQCRLRTKYELSLFKKHSNGETNSTRLAAPNKDGLVVL